MARIKYWLLGLEGDRRAFWGAYLVLLPLYLAPLFVARYLPGLDLPFHLSMADMLAKQGRPDSPYAPYYEGLVGLHPYALHFWALLALGKVMPLMAAHKICCVLYVAGLPLAAALLLHLCGRSRIPALLGFPLAYNLTFHYGFVSFAFSLPVLLLWLAALTWLMLAPADEPERERRRLYAGAAVAGLAGLALFLCHLQNFLYGACAALAFIALAGAPWRRRLLALATMAPAGAALLYWHFTSRFANDPAGQKRTLAFAWAAIKAERLGDLGTRSLGRDFLMHLEGVPGQLLRGFHDNCEVHGARALLLVLAAYLVLGVCGRFADVPAGDLRPRMRLAGGVAFLGALAAYIVLPHHLHAFELMTFAPRFTVLLVAMALLLVPGALRRYSGVLRPLVLLPAVLMCGLYGQDLIRVYRQYDAEVADFAAVVAKVPPGGRALGMVYDRTSRVMKVESALIGLPALYPVLRPAPGSMTPLPYCGMRHMPCRRKEAGKLPDPGPWLEKNMDMDQLVPFYDYFFVRQPPRKPIFGKQGPNVELLAQSGTWLVYKRKGAPPPAAPMPTAVRYVR